MARKPTTARRAASKLTRSDRRRLQRLGGRLEAWFRLHGRRFPWREPTASEYERICVEVLLQRTRAEAVSAYYETFFSAFPDWKSLHHASRASLEEALKPLGLWQRRARALAGLAAYATASNGKFPRDRDELEKVPAVGQYVANAILLFQHGVPEPLLDTNMVRVLERYVRPRKLADIRHDPWLQSASKYLVSSADPVSVNWGLLDIGATACIPRVPRCDRCPLKRGCAFNRD